ncbi:MAG: AI-2E family transporter [Bacteroidetes bacterium]|nr:AI-2E family transporter [Bacteroidota bacterium]
MNTSFKIPFYAKASLLFIGISALIGLLFVAQDIIIPIVYSTVLAVVLSPVVNFFVRKKLNRTLAITITILVLILITISTITLLSTQVSKFGDSFPALMGKLDLLLQQTVTWTSNTFNVSTIKINAWIDDTTNEIIGESRTLIGQTLASIGNLLVVIVLIPVYVFMILYYQPQLINFVHKIFSTNKQIAVSEVLTATKGIIQSYLIGLLLEALIVAILNTISLLIIGIEYAILLGVLGAMLNVIPYLGGMITLTLTMIVALATKTPFHALMVFVTFITVQIIDNNYLVPKVVASKVQINALMSIIVVIIGEALWGLNGMFLSIPVTAILKVIFDHVDGLKPWGYLLGDNISTSRKLIASNQKRRL